MTRGKRLKEARKALNLTQTELARLSGVKQNTISQVENDKAGLSIKTWEKVASSLGCSTSYLISGISDKRENNSQLLSFSQWLDVPMLDANKTACAGNGNGEMAGIYAEASDSIMLPGELLGTISINTEQRPFIIRVEGDSMEEAGIMDGSQVVVNPAEEVYDGDPALVSFGRNGDWAVKWVYWKKDGVEIRSSSLKYPPRSFDMEDIDEGLFQVIGKIVRTLGAPKRGA